jgi:hypothetical protein
MIASNQRGRICEICNNPIKNEGFFRRMFFPLKDHERGIRSAVLKVMGRQNYWVHKLCFWNLCRNVIPKDKTKKKARKVLNNMFLDEYKIMKVQGEI